MMRSGSFITFEGGEGAGKSSQATLLADRLRATGRHVVVTREPGGSPVAEAIRELILSNRCEEPVAEMLLFAAARTEHLAATIKPALARGSVVICDRYIDSTRVYQGVMGRVDPALITLLERETVAPWYPDLTLVLDLSPEVGLSRAANRGPLNRYDQNERDWHEALRTAFQTQANAEPSRCVLINADKEPSQVAADIWHAVTTRLGLGPA
jgi:dTMP kinase